MLIRAAVFRSRGGPLRVEDVEIESPRAGEILVRIAACGLCHADALAIDGDMPFPPPGVLGHEGAGVVVEIGSEVESVSVGDHVVLGFPWCGRCSHCLSGQPRYCAEISRLIARGSREDGSTALRARDGSLLHSHFFGQSSFATYAITRANQATPVPSELPLERLAPLGCGVSTGAGAVFNVLRPGVGSSLAVFGAGTVGLAAVMAARSSGATRIIAVDRHPARLELALELGATDVIEVPRDDPVGAVREICGGPADLALECTGDMGVLRQAVDSIGMLGVCGLIGGAPAGSEITIDHLSTMIGKRIVGIHGGEGTSPPLLRGLIELNQQGRFPFERLIQIFDLDQAAEALEAHLRGDVIKAVLRMPGS
jgi:aryl-alcohol dehydrogenase